jgi:hypothetical protein
MRRLGLIAALGMMLLALGAPAVSAQSFDLPAPERPHVWDFAMWCSALQGYPAERCEARTPEDEAEYQAYVARTSRFATAREYKPWLGPLRVRKANPGYYSPF